MSFITNALGLPGMGMTILTTAICVSAVYGSGVLVMCLRMNRMAEKLTNKSKELAEAKSENASLVLAVTAGKVANEISAVSAKVLAVTELAVWAQASDCKFDVLDSKLRALDLKLASFMENKLELKFQGLDSKMEHMKDILRVDLGHIKEAVQDTRALRE